MSVFTEKMKLRKNKVSDLSSDESGIAAMEFAIIAPVIIGVYLGLAELAMVLGVERQVSHSASVAGDLATQVTTLTNADSADMMSAVLRVANVTSTSDYVIHLESFERDSDNNVNSLGTVVYNDAKKGMLDAFDAKTLKADMLSEDSGIVVARVAYKYRPFGFQRTSTEGGGRGYLPSSVTLTETFLLKPRRSETVQVSVSAGTSIKCSGTASAVVCS